MGRSSVIAGRNGTHVETLLLGHPSNPSNLIDDEEHKTEIKSCRERHTTGTTTRLGHFKINIEQHHRLIEIDGFYLFAVIDEDLGKIIHRRKIRATEIESRFRLTTRTTTKHHYFSINWRKAMLFAPVRRKRPRNEMPDDLS